ncbi:hypothetical protein [Cedecea sp.]|uniref:hypothetical protein n=1 Tax=Cedecea sp. TaxID=1970739 RepID=UPI0012AE68FF|nr:hypothetical protein [Enterobacteriaceae bacterium RIT693]
MQLRILFFVLIAGFALCIGGALAYMSWGYFDAQRTPTEPCSSVIHDGRFIDENLEHYRFNGVITWWPKLSRLTLFGIKSDTAGDKVFNRSLVLQGVKRKGSVVHGRVAELNIAPGDQLPKKMFLISESNQDLALLFKPINQGRWLMMINDNWVMMCEYK